MTQVVLTATGTASYTLPPNTAVTIECIGGGGGGGSGGGEGSNGASSFAAGNGAQGIIVITFTPTGGIPQPTWAEVVLGG